MDTKKSIDPEIRELYENAHQRVKQKKKLMTHLVFFIAGAVIFIVLNVIIGYKADFKPLGMDWFVSAILIWLFFLIIHAINVFMVNKLMGKEWEEKQMNRLVEKQLERVRKIQKKVDQKHPIETETPKKDQNKNL
ncbi:2TM domain-containing protein [Psychroflexus sp. CAK57W]|uniref:2TM domain-containing protein n=1 Tax=Psychroflexus curvus TaxID=2873595 RepID=UPI001CCD256A|nr:2TM domain-containing protein [Psychroflexus curvus]MBZ9628023.1 2TM domain-containing protein [Psychroflexus curvus]MBZ9787722.1 2TM domain-containing protein [Psychroflexus curvus]